MATKRNANIAREDPGAAQRQQQIRYDDDHVDAEQRGSSDGSDLRAHGDDGEHIVMRAVQRIEKEQQPKAEHRKKVAEDRPARGGGNYEVDDGES